MCAPLASSGVVTAQVVSDNLKAGVTKLCFYEPALPVINRTYADLAAHYERLWCQRGHTNQRIKQKVEGAVLLLMRWILAPLRNRQFFSWRGDVNAAFAPLFGPAQRQGPRAISVPPARSSSEQLDKPALKPLSVGALCYAEWKKCRAGSD